MSVKFILVANMSCMLYKLCVNQLTVTLTKLCVL